MLGKTLTHYNIISELGRGGMGIVYKAEDTKLDRTVAIKVLPPAALASEDDRARFYREAKAAAQLHHQNIASVFEINEAVISDAPHGTEASPYIAMEFIDGDTLHEHIAKSPFKLEDAVRVTMQVASGLALAHSKNIVHRDIKSHNIMLSSGGEAKILDFGLAQTAQSTKLTRMGSTVGTIAYMSPEQARGEEVDHRTDLWSLGVVLYEMISGKYPFPGDYEQAVVYSILNNEPEPLTAIRTGVPMQLEWIVNKLLAKSPEDRYQSAKGLAVDLRNLDKVGTGTSTSGRSVADLGVAGSVPTGINLSGVAGPMGPSQAGHAADSTASAKREYPAWLLAALPVALLLGLFGGTLLAGDNADPDSVDNAVRKYSLDLPGFQGAWTPNISPDGKTLVIGAQDSLGEFGIFKMDLETSEINQIVGPTGGNAHFSPEGDRLLINLRGRGAHTIPTTGGTLRQIDQAAQAASWLPDGSLTYRQGDGLYLRSPSGSETRQISSLDSTEIGHTNPSALPDNRHIVFEYSVANDKRRRISIVDTKTGKRKNLGFGSHPEFLRSGHLLYGDGTSGSRGPLMVRPFDAKTLSFTGPEVTLHLEAPAWLYTVDRFGTWYDLLDYATEPSDITQVYRIENGGQRSSIFYEGNVENPRMSPDNSRLVLNVEEIDGDWIMILDMNTGVEQRINFVDDVDHAEWSSDGERLMLERNSKLEIWSSSGGGLLQTLPIDTASLFDWSDDGKFIAYINNTGPGGPLHLFDLETQRDTVLDAGSFNSAPRISPNGRFVAYDVHNENSIETFVRSITGNTFTRLSTGIEGSLEPVWSRDGRSIYVKSFRYELVRIPVDITNNFIQTGRAETLLTFSRSFDYDIGLDETLYVTGTDLFSDESAQVHHGRKLNVIVNWFEHVKKVAPPAK